MNLLNSNLESKFGETPVEIATYDKTIKLRELNSRQDYDVRLVYDGNSLNLVSGAPKSRIYEALRVLHDSVESLDDHPYKLILTRSGLD